MNGEENPMSTILKKNQTQSNLKSLYLESCLPESIINVFNKFNFDKGKVSKKIKMEFSTKGGVSDGSIFHQEKIKKKLHRLKTLRIA